MRRASFVDGADRFGLHDHICWAFDTAEEFRAVAGRFLADGLADGQRVLYLAPQATDTDLDFVAGFAAARAEGGAAVHDLHMYDSGGTGDAATQVQTWAAAMRQALADGYTGLRVAADVTPLVRTSSQRDAFARYEYLIDAFMARNPLAGMCGFWRGELGVEALAELACLHPLASRATSPFRLFASGEPGVSLVLEGEVDATTHALLRTALVRTDVLRLGAEVGVDVRTASYVDHRGLLQLTEHFGGLGTRMRLQVAERSVPHLLTDLLHLPGVQVVVS